MKVFNISQTKELDEYTIQNEPISREALMQRAAFRFARELIREIPKDKNVVVFAGPGNNGEDAKLIARFLSEKKYYVTLFENLNENFKFPEIKNNDLIIDGLFGAGINRPLTGMYACLVKYLNQSKARIYSIDIPSGLFGEDNSKNNPETIIKAYKTFTFQYPKLSFFFSENEIYTGEWKIIDINLHPDIINQTNSPYRYIEEKDIQSLLRKRNKFEHKGIFGHALIAAGSKGKYGAAVLASRACLRSGAGLLTTHVPSGAELVMQITVPEAMVDTDQNPECISEINLQNAYAAIGAGPGLGTHEETRKALSNLLKQNKIRLVLDADALNIISLKGWINQIPKNSILTPHPKEFDRLAGTPSGSFEQLEKARKLASELGIFIVLKGAYTVICTPDKTAYFNSTGNPGMATAGSGDVLTGIITGLLAQSYSPKEASLIGVFLHGLSGDIAVQYHSEESMIAGDIVDSLGKAFKKLQKNL